MRFLPLNVNLFFFVALKGLFARFDLTAQPNEKEISHFGASEKTKKKRSFRNQLAHFSGLRVKGGQEAET